MHIITDITVVGSVSFSVRINLALQFMNHLRTVAIQRQYVRETGAQLIENRNLTTAAFVHHRHTDAVTERRPAIHQNGIHILDAGVVADMVVGDIVVDVVQVALVAHFAVVQHGVVDSRVHFDAARQCDLAAVHS